MKTAYQFMIDWLNAYNRADGCASLYNWIMDRISDDERKRLIPEDNASDMGMWLVYLKQNPPDYLCTGRYNEFLYGIRDAYLKTSTISGTFRACQHDISYWYRADVEPLSEDDKEQLKDAAEERARELIADDCFEGELCHVLQKDLVKYGITEYRGWWSIERE